MLALPGAVSPDTWYEVDLTSHITADGTYSLRVSDSVGGADYSSKEGSNPPKLLVSVDGAGAAMDPLYNAPVTHLSWHRTPGQVCDREGYSTYGWFTAYSRKSQALPLHLPEFGNALAFQNQGQCRGSPRSSTRARDDHKI